MRMLTSSELGRRTSSELGVLHDMFNKALAAAKPFTAEWHSLAASVDAIQTERRGRLERPWRSTG